MIQWVIHSLLITALATIAFKYLNHVLPSWVYWSSLILKLVAGIILGMIFLDYYGSGDTLYFFDVATRPEAYAREPRTQFFIYLIRPLALITGSSYWITSLYLSLLSFVIIWYTVQIMCQLFPNRKFVFAMGFLFIPTVVFWSSGILKESIYFGAFALIVSITIAYYKDHRPSLYQLILTGVAFYVLFELKHYLFISALIFSSLLIAVKWYQQMNQRLRIGSILFLIAIGVSTQFVHPYLKIQRLSWTIHTINQAMHEKSREASSLDIVVEDDRWVSIFMAAPKALYAGLLRPTIMDPTPVWGWLHRIENGFLAFFMMLSLLLLPKGQVTIDRPLLVVSFGIILLLAIMLPLTSPNIGTLVRYKSIYFPFLFILCSILPHSYFTSKRME